MIKSHKHIIALIVFSFILLNCSSGGDDTPKPTPPVVVNPPGKASLSFPLENSECTVGSNLSSTQSTILFDWNDSNNTDTYQLFVKNLETQTISNYASNESEKSVTILRGTPYSWYVVSKNSGTETAQSATWKFYNAGEAESSYAPFPADLLSPAFDANFETTTKSVTLQWTGQDVDDDIEDYTILFGTVKPPTNEQVTTTTNSASVNVTSGNTYYWRVVTRDSQNNTSESEIFQFNVN